MKTQNEWILNKVHYVMLEGTQYNNQRTVYQQWNIQTKNKAAQTVKVSQHLYINDSIHPACKTYRKLHGIHFILQFGIYFILIMSYSDGFLKIIYCSFKKGTWEIAHLSALKNDKSHNNWHNNDSGKAVM